MRRTILLDGDIVLYVCCSSVSPDFDFDFDEEPESRFSNVSSAKQMFDAHVKRLKEQLDATHVRVAFSDKHENNWRRGVLPTYKDNRDGKDKPPGYYEVQAYAMDVYRGTLEPRLEADDVLGIWATGKKIPGEKIIVSDDKDFMSVPCQLYQPRHPERGVQEFSREDADRFHLLQTLMGDPVDGYTGIYGVGPVKAGKILDEECSWPRVLRAYKEAGLPPNAALVNARCARILRVGEYTRSRGVHLWKPTPKYTIYGE
jgi:DNA polymerase-1